MISVIVLLQELKNLITGMDGIVKKWKYNKRQCRKCEIDLGLFFLNDKAKSIGAYYENHNNDFVFWLGYWEKYGFCVSFHSEQDPFVEQFLKQLILDYHADYIKIDEQKYWYTISFKSQEDDKMILEAETIIKNVLEKTGNI